MERINKLCSYFEPCEKFIDVGCDHGYCTYYMLKSKKCNEAIVSDISELSLKKAETFLEEYIKLGVVKPVCTDGLNGIDVENSFVCIAGMGGDEIIKILENNGFVPQKLFLQPMKKVEKVRKYLLEKKANIIVDDFFIEKGIIYYVIKVDGKKELNYTDLEIKFGRDSFKNVSFKDIILDELKKVETYLSLAKENNKDKLLNDKKELLDVLKCL